MDVIHRPACYLKHDVSETGILFPFHLKTETESSLRNVVLYIKDRTMDIFRKRFV
jgi:hypothetical protein